MTPPRQPLDNIEEDLLACLRDGREEPGEPTGEAVGGSVGEDLAVRTRRGGAAAGGEDHRSGHIAAAPGRMTDDRTPPAMGTTTMSLTDRNLRTSSDEAPQVRSRRRWVLPAAGAVLLLAGCTVAGVNLLGGNEAPAPTAPPASSGPSAEQIQAAKDAAWRTVQTYDELSQKAGQVNSLEGMDLASVALPSAVQAEQAWVDNAVASGTHAEGSSQMTLISSEYNAAAPGAFAPQRVQISVCNDTSQVKLVNGAGVNVRVGPDGSTNYATRLVSNYWVYNQDGGWKTDGGTRTETPC